MPDLFQEPPAKKTFITRLGRLLELFIVLSILVAVYCFGIQDVPFTNDESHWIATSYYFEALFNGDRVLSGLSQYNQKNILPPKPVWEENYWTLTQPPLTRYVIALGRLSGGYQAKDLNTPWAYESDAAKNKALGALPSPGLLWWSRLPMAILAAISGLLFFLLVRSCAGRISGYAFVVLFVNMPYCLTLLRRAMGESTLLFFAGLTIAAGVGALVKWGRIKPMGQTDTSPKSLLSPFLWLMLMGVTTGLAGATKLNGLALCLAGALICYLIFRGSKGIVSQAARERFAIRTLVLSMLAAGIVFVIVNPYLHSDPLGRAAKMFEFRGREIATQLFLYPEYGIPDMGARLRIVPRRIFQDYMALNFEGAWIINVLLFGLGTFYLARTGWQWLAHKGGSPASIAIIAAATATVLPALFTPLDWDRYYLFPVIFVSCSIAIGIGMSLTITSRRLWIYLKHLKERYGLALEKGN